MAGQKDFIDEMVDRYGADDPTFRESYVTAIAEMELIDQLAALRRQRKISQEAVAKRMHTTQAAVSRIEKQADAKLSTIRSYADAIGARIAVLPS